MRIVGPDRTVLWVNVQLARHRRAIAVGWWFCFLGGPVWVVILVIILRRPRSSQ